MINLISYKRKSKSNGYFHNLRIEKEDKLLLFL